MGNPKLTSGEVNLTFSHQPYNFSLKERSDDKRTFASASTDETVRLWDLDTGRCLKILTGHTAWVRAIALTTDNQKLISSSTDGSIRIWDIATGESLQTLRPKRPYEEMNIKNVKGLSEAQKQALIALGATD